MFSPEQEAQLTHWGCPERYSYDPGFDDPILARQPHDVLAWLADSRHFTKLECNNPEIEWVAYRVDALTGNRGRLSVAADPYAATYALAQAVMEAQR